MRPPPVPGPISASTGPRAGQGPKAWPAPWSPRSTRGKAAFKPLYPDDLPLAAKIETVAKEIYRASGIAIAGPAQRRLKALEAAGYGNLPVCIAKTQYSFAADPDLRGAPTGHTLPIREIRLSAGAGFVVAMAGDIMSMPGLPRVPAAEGIRLTADGEVDGIF